MCFQCNAHTGWTTLSNLAQTSGDVVTRLIECRASLDLVGENTDERRAKSGGEFSVSEGYLDLPAPVVRCSGIKRA
jgi:hypothetical protein